MHTNLGKLPAPPIRNKFGIQFFESKGRLPWLQFRIHAQSIDSVRMPHGRRGRALKLSNSELFSAAQKGRSGTHIDSLKRLVCLEYLWKNALIGTGVSERCVVLRKELLPSRSGGAVAFWFRLGDSMRRGTDPFFRTERTGIRCRCGMTLRSLIHPENMKCRSELCTNRLHDWEISLMQ